MITANVIHRVFCLEFGGKYGTCFTIDLDEKQYLITARHLVENIQEKDTINIFHENEWKNVSTVLVGHCSGNVDISVLSTPEHTSPSMNMEPSSEGIVYGQDVYFLGFPYLDGQEISISKMNRNYPMPFVKKAIVSNMISRTPMKGGYIFYLDGHNNKGFSGGPVVFKKPGKKEYKVAAVISSYRHTEEPVFQVKDKAEADFMYKSNTGIILSCDIEHAIKVIRPH